MKPKNEVIHTGKLLKSLLIGLIVFLALICLYNGSSFAPTLPRADDLVLDDNSDPVIGSFVRKRDYFDELFEDQEHNPEVPKSIPVCFQLLYFLFNASFLKFSAPLIRV